MVPSSPTDVKASSSALPRTTSHSPCSGMSTTPLNPETPKPQCSPLLYGPHSRDAQVLWLLVSTPLSPCPIFYPCPLLSLDLAHLSPGPPQPPLYMMEIKHPLACFRPFWVQAKCTATGAIWHFVQMRKRCPFLKGSSLPSAGK